MKTTQQIRDHIVPVPQQVTAGEGEALRILPSAKFNLTVPEAEKGPIKTAGERIAAFLQSKCGEDCFAPAGISVKLVLGEAPAAVKNAKEFVKNAAKILMKAAAIATIRLLIPALKN